MSTAALAESVEEHLNPPSSVVVPQKLVGNGQHPIDEHPLLPVFVLGFIALVVSCAAIGSILLWLAFRDSGVMAPG